MRKRIVLIIVAIVIVGLVWFIATRSAEQSSDGRLSVVTSFYPLYYLAFEIGGEQVRIVNITPAGAEPHDYEPTLRDMQAIERADVLVINGAGLEPWSDSIKARLSPDRRVIEAASGLATLQSDPHVWLSPVLAKEMSVRIADAFTRADPEHAAYYRTNASALTAKLDALDADYRAGLARCARQTFVTSHAAFGYLAAAYGLRQVPIAGLSPDEEPSVQELADIAASAREQSVTHIFFEELVSPKLAQAIASEAGAQTLTLNPLEGLSSADIAAGADYLSVMRDNLANLKIALQCE